MQYRLEYQTVISASHQCGSEWPECSEHLHGHDWDIDIEIDYDPLEPRWWESYVDDVMVEINERHLNDMIRPSQPTPFGLANWIMQRLMPNMPVLSVSTRCGRWSAKVIADEVRRK